MRHFKCITFIISALSIAASCTNPYKELDYAIAHSAEYDALYQHRQDSIQAIFKTASNDSIKYELANQLQKEYFYHNADSCYKYACQMLELSRGSRTKNAVSKAYLSRVLIRLDSLNKAEKVFKSIDPQDIPDKEKYVYHFTQYTLVRKKFPNDTLTKARVLKEWIAADSTHADCFYIGKHDIASLEKIVADPISASEYAKAHYGIGMLSLAAGEEDTAIRHLAESARADMEISAKGYSALFELSRFLMRKGDVKRAIKYISCTRHDAEYYNFAQRMKDINGIEVETLNALVSQERKQKRTLYIITPIIIFLLMLSMTILVKLQHSRAKLEEVSNIKDEFLTTYMERCVDYLNKVDVYRSDLRHTAKKDGPDAVLAILRKPSFADSEFHKLLHDFDTAFLGIFPDFVEKINEITKEEYHYKLTEDGSMTTNLRILALIRLGITERKKIAKILNMSVGTVYAYHTHLQQHSVCSPSEFDKVVKKL